MSVNIANPPPPKHVPGPVVQRDVARYARSTVARQPAAGYYTVQSDDTLYSISTRFYSHPGEWVRIYNANRTLLLSPNEVAPGTRILIP